jgi:hypothetical protein
VLLQCDLAGLQALAEAMSFIADVEPVDHDSLIA